jgi:hypothetical protein
MKRLMEWNNAIFAALSGIGNPHANEPSPAHWRVSHTGAAGGLATASSDAATPLERLVPGQRAGSLAHEPASSASRKPIPLRDTARACPRRTILGHDGALLLRWANRRPSPRWRDTCLGTTSGSHLGGGGRHSIPRLQKYRVDGRAGLWPTRFRHLEYASSRELDEVLSDGRRSPDNTTLPWQVRAGRRLEDCGPELRFARGAAEESASERALALAPSRILRSGPPREGLGAVAGVGDDPQGWLMGRGDDDVWGHPLRLPYTKRKRASSGRSRGPRPGARVRVTRGKVGIAVSSTGGRRPCR